MKEDLISYAKNPIIITSILLCIFFYTGIIKLPQEDIYYFNFENVTSISGFIDSNPVKKTNGYYKCKIKLESARGILDKKEIDSSAYGKITAWIPQEIVEANYPGKLYTLSNYSNAIIEKNERVKITGKIYKNIFLAKDVECLEKEKSFINSIYSLRTKARLAFKRLMYSWGKAGGLVLSLLCGTSEYIEEGINEKFRLAGLSHILALSGMHLSFFTGIFTFLAKKTFGKKYSFIFNITGISLFVFLVGFTPSLFRSFLFTLIVQFSYLLKLRNIKLLPVLSFVFLLHSIFIPTDVFTVSFMLSYAALAGILLFADLHKLYLIRIMPEKISSDLSASMGALTTTVPISACVFGQIMPVSLISSLAISPLISFFMTSAFGGIILCLIMPFLAKPFGCIMNLIYGGITFLVKLFALFPPVTLGSL